jgi:diketogulonate reductase-like aldo/keto reductase
MASSAQTTQLKSMQAVMAAKPNNTGLPNQLKTGIENLSGMSMDHVKVHYNSDKPAQLQAHAYAQGSEIHVSPGQEKHLPHEAWHVVQQAQGRVKPTMQMKGDVPVNDDIGLEQEADVMGDRAFANGAHTSSELEGMVQQQVDESSIIQRQPIDVAVTGITHLVVLKNGSLYSKNFLDNEAEEVHEGDFVEIESESALRSRRGPNQEDKALNAQDETGPSWYMWYVVNRLNGKPVRPNTYIRDDTFRQADAEDEQAMPLRSTIFGTADATLEGFNQAYAQGYRDFDTAYDYHKGGTAAIIKQMTINSGTIRLIYKFKLEELKGAIAELKNLASIPNVLIHTIMLHEIPAGNHTEALNILKGVAEPYNAKTGLSNVVQEDVDSADNFTEILKEANSLGIKISSVQNRMSPGAPDKAVREVCDRYGIDYMAFGLKGGAGHDGTCKMGPDSAVEDFSIENDALFSEKAAEYGIEKDMLRFVMLDWGRKNGVSVISQSRSEQGMINMRVAFPAELLSFLDNYGHGNEFYPHHPDQADLYLPFEKFLEKSGIDLGLMQPLFDHIPMNLWRMYYKHTVSREAAESDFVKVMQTADANEVAELIQLAGNNIETVTDLGNLFLRYKSGERAVVAPTAPVTVDAYPQVLTDQGLRELGSGLTIDGKAKYLYNMDAFEAVSEPSGVAQDVILDVLVVADSVARYKKTGADQWALQ